LTSVSSIIIREISAPTAEESPMPALSQEQVLFEDTLIKAISNTSPPDKVAKLDAAKRFDGELHSTLAQLGVWGLGVDEQFQGSGGTNIEQLIALRALGSLSTSTAVFCVVQFMITRLLKDNANAAQKEKWLKPLA